MAEGELCIFLIYSEYAEQTFLSGQADFSTCPCWIYTQSRVTPQTHSSPAHTTKKFINLLGLTGTQRLIWYIFDL